MATSSAAFVLRAEHPCARDPHALGGIELVSFSVRSIFHPDDVHRLGYAAQPWHMRIPREVRASWQATTTAWKLAQCGARADANPWARFDAPRLLATFGRFLASFAWEPRDGALLAGVFAVTLALLCLVRGT